MSKSRYPCFTACIHYRAGCIRSYISRVPGVTERGNGRAKKWERQREGKGPGRNSCPTLIQRVYSRSAYRIYIVSSVYEARFKLFTLAFTFHTPLRLRSLRMPLAAFLRQLSTSSSADTGINGFRAGLRTGPLLPPFSPLVYL